jgi:hypothetical protein
MIALQVIFRLCANRDCWRFRAWTTRARICAEVSPVRSPGDPPEFHLRHFHVQINPVQQRPRNPAQIILNFPR